jgi:hypothetical protein
VLVLPVALSWLGQDRTRRRRIVGLALAITLIVATVSSGSRGAAVGAGIAIVASFFVFPSLRRWAGPCLYGCACVAAIALLTGSNIVGGSTTLRTHESAAASDASRSVLLHLAISQAESRPVDGVGFSTIEAAHVIYVELLSSGGAIALGAFIVLILGFAGSGIRAIKADWDDVIGAALIALGVWLVVGIVESQIVDGYVYIAPGILLAAGQLAKARDTRAHSSSGYV